MTQPTQTPIAHNLNRLLDILTLKRGHGSVGERKLIEQILLPYNPKVLTEKGEPMAYVITTDITSKVLFTSHIDTVHNAAQDAKQMVIYDTETQMMYKQDDQPLGADDGAGVWLLLELIDAGVPGSYIFFRGEERGGIGSKSVSDNPECIPWLKSFDQAIAFDRRDTCSIITHQARGRCCSDAYASAFARLLTDITYDLKPDSGGVYTDTAELTHLIPECTNVSIGYYNEHSKAEILDVEYLLWLRDRLILQADLIHQLPITRDPTAFDYEDWGYGGFGYSSKPSHKSAKSKPTHKDFAPCDEYDVCNMSWRETAAWVEKAAPEDVADLLQYLAEELVYRTSMEQDPLDEKYPLTNEDFTH